MGATLVAKVVQRWASRLGDSEFRVLVAMAVTAKDNGTPQVPASMFYNGHDALVLAIRPTATADHKSLLKTVQRAIKGLIGAGAIELVQRAESKGRAIYRLTLENPPAIHKRDSPGLRKLRGQVDTGCPPQEDTTCPAEGDTTCPPKQDTRCPPLSKEPLEEPLEELEEENGVTHRGPVAVRAREPSACADPTCELGFIYDKTRPKGQRNVRCPTCHPPNVIPFRERRKGA